MKTNLHGRLKKTRYLPKEALQSVYEAVANSIHSIDEQAIKDKQAPSEYCIEVALTRGAQLTTDFVQDEAPLPLIAATITDNGSGFTLSNFESFKTLDSDYKESLGGKGIGRLSWLVMFDRVKVNSGYVCEKTAALRNRTFTFTEAAGVLKEDEGGAPCQKRETCVHLGGFKEQYGKHTRFSASSIAGKLLDHFLQFFFREGGCPSITIVDGSELVEVNDLFDLVSEDRQEDQATLGDETFTLWHVKNRNVEKHAKHTVKYCANGFLVKSEEIKQSEVMGLNRDSQDSDGPFSYSCYVSGDCLNDSVNSERTGFSFENTDGDEGILFGPGIKLSDIKNNVLVKASRHLEKDLEEAVAKARLEFDTYIRDKSPRYTAIARKLTEQEKVEIAMLNDRKKQSKLHEKYRDLELRTIEQGEKLTTSDPTVSTEDYRDLLLSYRESISDIQKTDLANYVFHRKAVIALYRKALESGVRDAGDTYALESFVHDMIMPSKTTNSADEFAKNNLWMIDENLEYFGVVESDRPIKSIPGVSSNDKSRPDIVAIDEFIGHDRRSTLSDKVEGGRRLAISIIEFKKPGKFNLSDSNPLDQALQYLRSIREGKEKDAAGRKIHVAKEMPAYIYVICELGDDLIDYARDLRLHSNTEGTAFFGFIDNKNAYIQLLNLDYIADNAERRNKAFFDRLLLP